MFYRRGRETKIPQLKGKKAVRTMREQSFLVNGPRLLNSIPKQIRNMTKVSVKKFKEHLDKFLEMNQACYMQPIHCCPIKLNH